MEYQKLDPKAKKMWRVGRIFGLAIMLVAYGFGIYIFYRTFSEAHLMDLLPLAAISMALPIILQILNLLIYPPVEYRQWAYMITADRIEIKKGIFFHSTKIVPISRIQHVTVSEGPLARFYKLASVTINTAGGSMKIEGLAKETAEAICENLKTVINVKVHSSRQTAEGTS